MTSKLERLRKLAISHSLFPPTSLKSAIERLGFVQADPIRAPARAQDLILRHRVTNYRAGDLEEHYGELDMEEDVFHVYGFLPHKTWEMLHPRAFDALPDFHRSILDAFRKTGTMHPKELAERFGPDRAINAWGGYSRSTQLALDNLHERGLLRVVRRDKGNRIYEAAPPFSESLPASERLRELAVVVADLLAPIPRLSFNEVVGRVRRSMGVTEVTTAAIIDELLSNGALEQDIVDGITYLWPASDSQAPDVPRMVRFLAPFDPVVWDRRRFEHLWGWPYRFEGYTPAVKRTRGYYAMPLLWCDSMIGWANVAVSGGRLKVELGFVESPRGDPQFESELAEEIGRMEAFLGLQSGDPAPSI